MFVIDKRYEACDLSMICSEGMKTCNKEDT